MCLNQIQKWKTNSFPSLSFSARPNPSSPFLFLPQSPNLRRPICFHSPVRPPPSSPFLSRCQVGTACRGRPRPPDRAGLELKSDPAARVAAPVRGPHAKAPRRPYLSDAAPPGNPIEPKPPPLPSQNPSRSRRHCWSCSELHAAVVSLLRGRIRDFPELRAEV